METFLQPLLTIFLISQSHCYGPVNLNSVTGLPPPSHLSNVITDQNDYGLAKSILSSTPTPLLSSSTAGPIAAGRYWWQDVPNPFGVGASQSVVDVHTVGDVGTKVMVNNGITGVIYESNPFLNAALEKKDQVFNYGGPVVTSSTVSSTNGDYGQFPTSGMTHVSTVTISPNPSSSYGGETVRPTPYPGCPAALKCVPENYCNAQGVATDISVPLTHEFVANRVPLSICEDIATGSIGKCCRDPNYKDPWPENIPHEHEHEHEYEHNEHNIIPTDINVKPTDGYPMGPSNTNNIIPISSFKPTGDYGSVGIGNPNQPQQPQLPSYQIPQSTYYPNPLPPSSTYIPPQSSYSTPPPTEATHPSEPLQTYPTISPGQPPNSPQKPIYYPQPPTYQPGYYPSYGPQYPPVVSQQPLQPPYITNPQQSGYPHVPEVPAHLPSPPHKPPNPLHPSYPTPPQSFIPPSTTPHIPISYPVSTFPPKPEYPSSTIVPSQPSYPSNPNQPSYPSQPSYPYPPLTHPSKPSYTTPTPSQSSYPSPHPLQPPYPSHPLVQPSYPSQPPSQPSYPHAPPPHSQPSYPSPPPSQASYPNSPSHPPYKPSYPLQPAYPPQQPSYPGQIPYQPGYPQYPPQHGYPDYLHHQYPGYYSIQPGHPVDTGYPSLNQRLGSTLPAVPPVIVKEFSSVCGVRKDDGTAYGNAPWHAIVYSNRNKDLICAGAIVSENAILTTAHCLHHSEAETTEVKLGPQGKVYKVAAIARHAEYDQQTLSRDLALVFLREPIQFDKYIMKICLPTSFSQIKSGNRECYVSTLAKEFEPKTLEMMPVEVFTYKDCEVKLRNTYLGKYFILNDSFSCVSSPSDKELCSVKTGSPIACKKADDTYELFGIKSWDLGCQEYKSSAIFSNFDIIWVQSTLASPIGKLINEEKEKQRAKFKGESLEGVNINEKPAFGLGYGKK